MADEIKEKTGWFGDKYKEVVREGKVVARIDTETNFVGEKVDVTRDMSTPGCSSPIISTETHKKTPGGDEIIEKRDDGGNLISSARDEGLIGNKELVAREELRSKKGTDEGKARSYSSTGGGSGSSSKYIIGSVFSGSLTAAFKSRCRTWKFPKLGLAFIAWTGGSWLLQQFCLQGLKDVTEYSLAWWLMTLGFIASLPGVIVGGLAVVVVVMVFLVIVLVVQTILRSL